jgi:hypothetical protein
MDGKRAGKIAVSKIALVDKCENGLFLTFRDGRSAFYSDELLLELFPRAEEWPEAPDDPEA